MNNTEPQPNGAPDQRSVAASARMPEIAQKGQETDEARGRQEGAAAQDWAQAEQANQKKLVPAQPPSAADQKAGTNSGTTAKTTKTGFIAGVIIFVILTAIAVGIGIGCLWNGTGKERLRLVLYGNVDLRQVELAFNNSERITEVLVQEGDKVKHGQILARLDTSRLVPELEGARADLVNARQQWERLTTVSKLTTGRAISQQDLDAAKAALDISQARTTLSERKLADAELMSPCDAVVRTRILEPGEMSSPQRAVLDLSITNPKWIRAYVSETDLGNVQQGMKASIAADSFPGRTLSGWVGFISSIAEFTPKTVQTQELRPNLVYEIRVFVEDPHDDMRLGMPATITLEMHPSVHDRP
jgi:HlyD family secretion protein